MNRISSYGWAFALILTLLGWVWVAAGDRSVALERIRDLDMRLGATQKRHEDLGVTLGAMQTDLAQIRTDIGWIRQELRRLSHQPHPRE